MKKEEFQRLWREDALDMVHRDAYSYRHGAYHDDVYEHEGRLWAVSYTVNGDGENNGLDLGDFDGPTEVFPHTVLTTEFRPKAQGALRFTIEEVHWAEYSDGQGDYAEVRLKQGDKVLGEWGDYYHDKDKAEAWIDGFCTALRRESEVVDTTIVVSEGDR